MSRTSSTMTGIERSARKTPPGPDALAHAHVEAVLAGIS